MKNLIFIILFSTSIFAQNIGKIADNIVKLEAKKTIFKKVSIFSEITDFENQEYKKAIDSATIVKLNLLKINQIVAEKSDYLEIEIPYQNKIKTVILYKVEIQAGGFSVLTDKNNGWTLISIANDQYLQQRSDEIIIMSNGEIVN